MIEVVIVILAIIAIGLYIASKTIIVVHTAEGVVIERLGKFHRLLLPGFNCIVPFFDTARNFSWKKTYIDRNKRVREEKTEHYRVDCRESMFNFLEQQVYTRDTIQLRVNALMYYRIMQVKKAIYGVDDLHAAVGNVAQSEMKMIFGSMTFTEALSAQDKINKILVPKFNQEFEPWGVYCTRVEILDLMPSQSVVRQLKLQMLAERNRRAAFIVAEGQKSAMRKESEGIRVEKYQMGVAEQEATRRLSEGQASAKVNLAQAESRALNVVQEAISKDGASQSQYLITGKYLELLNNVVSANSSSQDKTIYLPFAVEPIMGFVGTLPSVYGRGTAKKSSGRSGTARTSRATREEKLNDDDLN